MAGLFELFWILVLVAFVALVIGILWQILQALHGINRSLDDVAKILRNQKPE